MLRINRNRYTWFYIALFVILTLMTINTLTSTNYITPVIYPSVSDSH